MPGPLQLSHSPKPTCVYDGKQLSSDYRRASEAVITKAASFRASLSLAPLINSHHVCNEHRRRPPSSNHAQVTLLFGHLLFIFFILTIPSYFV
jgi:hypothetical protein